MWTIYLLPKLPAKWPAFFGERPQLPGPLRKDVRWSMAGTAVLSLFIGRLKKRAFLHAKVERRGYQWTEVNIQRKLGLPPSSVGLPGGSNFSFVCFLKTVSDWKKPRNTCTPAFTRPSFDPSFFTVYSHWVLRLTRKFSVELCSDCISHPI